MVARLCFLGAVLKRTARQHEALRDVRQGEGQGQVRCGLWCGVAHVAEAGGPCGHAWLSADGKRTSIFRWR